MKKNTLITAITLIIISLLSSTVYADTVYEYYGLTYSIINNFSVSVSGCEDSVTSVFVPEQINKRDVVDISNNAFVENTVITSVDFSKATKLKRIGSFAFKSCPNLNGTLTLPLSVNTIDIGAFEDCSQINNVKILSDIATVPKQCFNGCSSLSDVQLNNSITAISGYAFANCSNLDYIIISDNVTSIAKTAFLNDTNLTIGCNYGSYAYNYAVENNIPVKILGGVLFGDVNGDEEINIMDATIIQKKSLGIATADVVSNYDVAADVSKDGFVNIRDVTLIQMYVAGIITEF